MRISIIAIIILVVYVYLVYDALKSNIGVTDVLSIYIKTIIIYFQQVSLITEFKLSWPKPVKDLLQSQGLVGGATTQLYSVDCLLSDEIESSALVFQKQIYIAMMPICMLVGVTIFWLFYAAVTRRRNILRRKLPVSVIIIYFLFYHTLAIALFSMFSCTEAGSGDFWLTSDMAIPCWDSKHIASLYMVGIPSVIIWVIGVPLAALIILVKLRKYLHEEWLRVPYGYLLNGYRESTYYWEFVIFARKIAIVSCSVFITNAISIQALAVQLVFILALFLQFAIAPYNSRALNNLELYEIIVADVTIYCGLFYLTEKLSLIGTWLLFICIILANAVFFIYWIVKFLPAFCKCLCMNLCCNCNYCFMILWAPRRNLGS